MLWGFVIWLLDLGSNQGPTNLQTCLVFLPNFFLIVFELLGERLLKLPANSLATPCVREFTSFDATVTNSELQFDFFCFGYLLYIIKI